MPSNINFIGLYEHSLDSKSRLMIPQVYRDIVARAESSLKFFLNRGFDECLAMYTESTWNEMVQVVKSHKEGELSDEETRKFSRWFFSSAVEVAPDKAGRILIPEHLRQLAGLRKQVVLIGVSDHVEIWDAERHAYVNAAKKGDYERSAKEAFRRL
jgi:MraZ protein